MVLLSEQTLLCRMGAINPEIPMFCNGLLQIVVLCVNKDKDHTHLGTFLSPVSLLCRWKMTLKLLINNQSYRLFSQLT